MKEITVGADVSNLPEVTDFVKEILEGCDCPVKAQMQIDVALDEIFSNIAFYAYEDKGDATVRVEVKDGGSVEITFIDSGKPYDPLLKPDPDVTLSVAEREIGGLGIYMVKKTMDEVGYEYKDGKNVFRMKKYI